MKKIYLFLIVSATAFATSGQSNQAINWDSAPCGTTTQRSNQQINWGSAPRGTIHRTVRLPSKATHSTPNTEVTIINPPPDTKVRHDIVQVTPPYTQSNANLFGLYALCTVVIFGLLFFLLSGKKFGIKTKKKQYNNPWGNKSIKILNANGGSASCKYPDGAVVEVTVNSPVPPTSSTASASP